MKDEVACYIVSKFFANFKGAYCMQNAYLRDDR